MSDPWTDPVEDAKFREWLRGQAAEGHQLPGDVAGDDDWNHAVAEATADYVMDNDDSDGSGS